MKSLNTALILACVCVIISGFIYLHPIDSKVHYIEIDPLGHKVRMHYLGPDNEAYGNIRSVNEHLESSGIKVKAAMNGGMYMKDLTPLGLYVEDGEQIRELNTEKDAYGNFYLQPNGVFYIKEDGTPGIVETEDYSESENIRYATQSGPLLISNGEFHPEIREGSKNLHIRNGVGVTKAGNIILAISKEKINFYDFASFFESKGCKNALYLDGYVSEMYCPELDLYEQDGHYSIIISVVENE